MLPRDPRRFAAILAGLLVLVVSGCGGSSDEYSFNDAHREALAYAGRVEAKEKRQRVARGFVISGYTNGPEPRNCTHGKRRPSVLLLDCGGGTKFYRLHWNDWGKPVTRARGLAWGKKCATQCRLHLYPVRLIASKPLTCPNGEHRYRELRWSFPKATPWEIRSDHRVVLSCQFSEPNG